MVEEARDGADSCPPQRRQPLVRPRPIDSRHATRSDALPEQGVANGRDTEALEQLDVLEARVVSGQLQLVCDASADPDPSTFEPGPHLGPAAADRPRDDRGRTAAQAARLDRSAILRNMVSAWATTWSML